ncbi:PREDICTED: mucin-6 [Colobus angolensis palliatus]|uniref:mucin-6 n=1 Tax=Colobus angolensis palliatus TaxID=336983 RepID=UPI0005F4CCA4|nr:PREDICTED: mucin-6 [Colobus angolensis palliatus]
MLRPWLLLSCCGTLLSTGLAATSYTSPGLWRLKDSPQTAPDKGQCSTWGAGHFSTFDHHVYDFSGTCNYIFAATCKDAFPTFSVQLRRGPDGSISRIIVELGASVVTVSEATISVKDVGVIGLPYTSNGLQITPFGQSVRLVAKQLELELEVMWGPDSHLMVLVERKYMGQMCGLCGNFDGKVTNEFVSEEGKFLEPHKFAALQKLDDPGEICTSEDIPNTHVRQVQHAQTCTQLLTLVAPECNVSKEPFVLSCQADVAAATQPGPQNSSCATLSEYSRQCSMLGQPVRRWRGPGLCSVGQCPANQVYQECGSACMKTCSNPQHSCSSSCTFGCFCPEGTVLNDLSSNHTCVPVTQCPCLLNGAMYAPGEVTIAACQTCQCTQGRWACRERPCPGHCSLEGGSFITTFDARPYRFHGTCTYILLQSPQLPEDGALMAVYDKSGFSHSETSLVAVIYLSRQDKIVISQDEVVTNNGEAKWLPYKTRNITVFRQTSTHLQMATSFGLELVVQLRPVFQAYITVGPQFRGQTRGLCGTFNGDTTDDFTTSVGIAEGTASLFVDSWRAGNCPAALERETDPCSMSQLNKVCAETHCSVLLRTGTVFERCHATVNPAPFYKRCVYQACNYEETFPHICAALGDYVHACSARGVPLWGWRSSVDNCTVPCTGNTTFSYNSQACERTCLSLSDRAAECHASAVPVDGCNCPNGTYLNHKGECVRKAQCPCTLEGYKFILAEQSTIINGVTCYCINGRLTCPQRLQMFLASCQAPKTFKSCNQSSENKFGAACAPTCQMLATGVACVPTKCEPGCVCAEGLYENADGQCVPPEECPCEFSGVSYPGGAELHTDCRTCTCSRGRWDCQQGTHCPSTCTLYGEGHIVTFDGQRFVFDGNCEYILATDGCGANDSQPTFKILTENVICGNSGVTCSRAIKIFLGGLSVVLADGNYTVTGEESHVQLSVRPGTLSLVVDISVPGRYNLTLIWNRHMTILIRITRASQDPLCGLCGNFNGNMKDDFETRSRYVASSELEFVNSWKESPLCGDVSFVADPCSLNTFRRSWAERKCSIINSQTFAACHSKVYHLPYYEACVRDACGCDSGGDCECLCDAVAAYAQACLDKGVCVDWRTPAFCPIYCGFYNTHTQDSHGEYQYTQEANCTWHYQPCLCPGQPESVPGSNIEGCYNCSQDEYFDHEEGVCVPCMPATTPQPSTTGLTWQSELGEELSPQPGSSLVPVALAGPTDEHTAGPQQLAAAMQKARPGARLHSESHGPALNCVPGTSAPVGLPSFRAKQAAGRVLPKDVPVPCSPDGMSVHPGSRPTQVWPTTGTSTTIGLLSSTGPSSSSKRTSASPTQTPLLPATLTSSKPTASSGEPPRPTTAVTPQATSGLPPTATLSSTATKPTVTQATTRATASTASPATTSTAQSTTRTTVTPPPPATSGTSPTLPKSTNQELPGTTATQTTGPRPTPESTTGPTTPQPGQPTRPTATETTQTGMTTEHTTPQTPHITHSPPVGSPIASTGPMTATSFQTTTTYPTPSHPQTTLPTHVPPFSTSLVTPSTHTVITTTHAQRSTSSSIHSVPIGTIPPPTTVKVTGSTHTAPPTTVTTSRTSQAHSSFSTTTASTSLHSHASSTHHPEITLTSTTTITPNPTSTGTGTPVAYTTLVTSSRPPPPFTTYSPLTGSTPVSSTGPMTATSFQTTTTYPTPSHPQTTLPTHVPPFSTSLVTPTTHTVITPTHIHLSTSASIHSMPTGTIPPPTALTTTGSMHTAPSMTVTTSGTSKAPSSFSTAKTSTSFYSHASSTHHPEITSTSTTTITPKSTSAGTTPPITATTSGTSQALSSFSTAKTSTSLHSHTSSIHHPEVTPTSTTIIPNPTSTGTGTPVAHTTLATSSRLPTIFTTHSPPTGSTPVSSTGRMTATSFQTTTTYPTPSHPQTTLPTHVPPFSTSLVTPTTHTVITPTQTQMSTSASIYSMPTGTISPLTTVEATGSTHTAPPMTATTSGTSQALSSFSTAKTSTSLHSHSSSTHHPEVTPTSTTITPNPTTTGTGTPVAHTTSATSSRLPTPFTTHSPPTGSTPVSSTGPMTVTSFQSTTTYPTPSHPQTTLPTHVPPFSTSLVTPTTHIVITPTHPQMSTFSSIPSMPTGTISPSTMVKATGSTHTAPPMIVTTSGTRQTHSSFSTTTASSFLSSSSWRPQNSSSRPPSPPSATTQLPNLSSATTPVSTTNQLSSSFSPTPSAQSSVSSHVPSSHSSPQTSSSAGTSSSVVSTPVHSTTLSSSSHSFFTHPMTASGSASPLFPSSPAASTTIRASLPHTISSPFTLSALLPISTLTVSPTPSSHPASSTTAFLSTPRTTASTHAAPAFSSQSTTSRSTSLTTRVPTSGFVSLTWGVTGIPSSPVTNITTRHPGPTSLPTTQFLTSSLTAHGSAPASAPVSSLGTPTPTSPGVCSVQERQEEITFKGCMANVTVTRCEGTCISAASFNTITQQMDAHCGCCRPLHSHEQQLELPCPDPSAPGRWLILTLQVFSRCECSSVACGD